MRKSRALKRWMIAGIVILVLVIAGLVGAGGCGGDESESWSAPSTTAGYFAREAMSEEDGGMAFDEAASVAPEAVPGIVAGGSEVNLSVLKAGADQKIMANAELDIEVEAGEFQAAFAKALLLADRYGGYVLSSNSYASGEEDSIKSGAIAIRVPANVFAKALSDAAKLGELKRQSVWTEDVSAEYVDLQARIVNQQAYVNSILALLAKAKTVQEILTVQQTLTYAQQELEQLKGRMRYLDEHTAFSTLTLSIYETGVEATPPGEWGFIEALKDAVHNLVDAFSAVVRGLGWIVPVLVILGIIGFVIYLLVRAATRKSRQRAQTEYPTLPTGPGGGAQGPGGGERKDGENKTS
jgi:hypothetical protein